MAGAVEGKYESSGSRFKSSSNIADANTVHIEYLLEAGSYCFKVAYNTTANIPVNTNGMLIHTQRADYNNVSTTNIIKQVYNSHSSTFIRHGRGDGENIVFSNWQRIDNFGYNTLAELVSGIDNANKAKTSSTSVAVDSGEEGSLSLTDSTGLLVISNSFLTRDYDVAIFSSGTQAIPIVTSENNNINYGSSISGKLCFYRESNNAALTIKNNSSQRAVLKCLCIRPLS